MYHHFDKNTCSKLGCKIALLLMAITMMLISQNHGQCMTKCSMLEAHEACCL